MVAQEDSYSCGAACARQLLLDVGIVKSEAEVRKAAGFVPNVGIHAQLLAAALTTFDHPSRRWQSTSPDPSELLLLVARAPFVAMLVKHWVIVDGFDGSGLLRVRDPAPLPSSLSSGTEGLMIIQILQLPSGHTRA